MNQASRGAEAISASDFPTALSAYTQALVDHPTSPDYFSQRSLVFTRLKPARYDLALKDAEYAVLLAQQRAVREKIQAAQHRRLVALHGLGRYADAKLILTAMARWRSKESKPDKMQGDIWMAKVESKLKTAPPAAHTVAVTEYPDIKLPSADEIVTELKAQLNADGSFKLDGDANDRSSADGPLESAASPGGIRSTIPPQDGADTVLAAAEATSQALPKVRHEWYQNAESVTITIYAKGVSKDTAEIAINDDAVDVSFPHPVHPSATFSFALDPLFALVDPSKSRSSVMSTKIELKLQKSQVGQKWHALEGTARPKPVIDHNDNVSAPGVDESAKQSATLPPKTTAPSYPTSSRHGPKNWDKVANDLHSQMKAKKAPKRKVDGQPTENNPSPPSSDDDAPEEDVDSDFETGDPVDGFFKKLYAGADPDTRRAMMKSFYESNGTALSTSWADVGKGKVEEVKSSKDDA